MDGQTARTDRDDGAAPRRTRVVLGEAAAARRPADPARADLTEQTPVGEALVKGLVRAQLALAPRLALVVGPSSARCRCCSRWRPPSGK